MRDVTFKASYLRQILELLFLRAISMNLIDAEIRMSGVTESDGGRCSSYFFYDNYVIEICTVRATILRLHRRGQQTQFTQLPPKRLYPYHFFIELSIKALILDRKIEFNSLQFAIYLNIFCSKIVSRGACRILTLNSSKLFFLSISAALGASSFCAKLKTSERS